MKQNKKMVIGLIGGSGTGKTYIANYIKNVLNASFIEADKIGHDLLEDSGIIKLLTETFGISILKDGIIDRHILGTIVFNDSNELRKLNHIMHPAMYKVIQQTIKSSQTDFVILEAAVMIEAHFYELVDQMLWVDCSNEIRLERLIQLRHIDETKALGMIDSTKGDYHLYAKDYINTTDGFDAIKENLDMKLRAYEEAYNETLL